MIYAYSAVDTTGKRSRGSDEAASPEALSRTLTARGLVVVDVEPAPRTAQRGGESGGWRPNPRQDVLEATRALAALLGAGVTLSRALSTVAAITPGRAAAALDDVRLGIGGGQSLADALARHPRLFSPLYVGVVRAGERSGALAASFAALAAQLERQERLRARILSAMLYPLLLAVAATAASAVLVLFVLPRFAELLESAHATLPRSTAALLAVAGVLQHGWPLILAALALAAGAVVLATRSAGGRRAGAAMLLRLPVAGSLRRHTLAARFARVLGVLLAGGAPLLPALDDALESLSDPLARDEIGHIRTRVRDGAALNAAIAEGTLFPPLLSRLVAVGEEAGQLEQFLARSAEICEEKVDRLLQRLVSLAEPAMILVFGALVVFVALSLLQAIYGVDAGAFR